MKTLLFTLEYPPFKGGVANYYNNLVKYWPESKNMAVLNNNDSKLIKGWLWPKWLLAIWHLWRIAKKEKISYILVGQVLPLGTATWILSYFVNYKYSVILHGMDFTNALQTARKRWITMKIFKKTEKIICANSYVAELVKGVLDDGQAKKVSVVNPGIENKDLRFKNEDLRFKFLKKHNIENKIILFSIGRLVKRKGFDKVIAAMPKVLKQAPNLIYVIAGDGPDKYYLKKLAEDKENIIFLEKITDEEKWAWLNLSDIFIMPSRQIKEDFEGFGIVYLEANLCGKPVIAGDSGGVRDAVKDKVSGLLVDPEDTNKIADAIIKLAKDKNLREKLGKQGGERVIKEFNWGKQVKKIYEIIKLPSQ